MLTGSISESRPPCPGIRNCVVRPPNYNPERLPEIINKVHERLQAVQIETIPYEQILAKYDRPQTLFYLDPPYWGRKLYKFNFSEKDFTDLNLRLKTISGKFILSLNDLPDTRKIFGGFNILPVQISYTAQMHSGKRYREILIKNF